MKEKVRGKGSKTSYKSKGSSKADNGGNGEGETKR